MPSRGEYWKVGGINDQHIVEADLDQSLQDKINSTTPGDPIDFLFADLSVDQITDLGVNDHVEFNTIIESNNITLSTGAGQLSGLIGNLKADTVYMFEAGLTIAGSTNTAELQYQFRDNTTTTVIGHLSNSIMVSSNANVSFQPIVSAIHKTSGAVTEVELRITLNNSVTAIESDFAYLRVIELTR